MAPVLSKNAILQGTLDYFCLVCEAYLKSDKDTEGHISKPVHQKNLEAVQYAEEFKMDCIKKIKNKYFCELCNALLAVSSRVRMHITEQTHIDKRNLSSLKRVGDSIIAFGKVLIHDNAWNCLHKNSCDICNIEFEDEEIHKNLSTHLLNVVQIQVEFDDNKNIYRKIDAVSFQCLTCDVILSINSLKSHFLGDEHKKQYQVCCDATIKISAQTDKIQEVNNNSSKDDVTNPGFIKKEVTNEPIQKNVKENKKPIKANNQRGAKEIKYEKDIEPIKQSECIFDIISEDEICKNLHCKDYICVDENDKSWCILCDWITDSANVRNHVNGEHHKTIYKLHKEREKKLKNKYINNNNSRNDINSDSNNKDIINCNSKKVVEKKENSKILNNLSEFQSNNININFEFNTAICKKCSTNLEFDSDIIKNHISEHKRNEVKNEIKPQQFFSGDKMSPKKNTLVSSPVFFKRDDIKKGNKSDTEIEKKTNEKGDKSNTNKESKLNDIVELSNVSENSQKSSIEIKPPSKIVVPKQIVGSESQISSVKIKKPKAVNLYRVQPSQFIENIVAVDHCLFKDVVINSKYCINLFSFAFSIHQSSEYMVCQACEVTCNLKDFLAHIESPKHAIITDTGVFIINDDSEFIREIRPGCFHCGFCNTVESSWEDMEMHLKRSSHNDSKTTASWRLAQYKPNVARTSFHTVISDQSMLIAFIRNFY